MLRRRPGRVWSRALGEGDDLGQPDGVECSVMEVPVRDGQLAIRLKRFLGTAKSSDPTHVPKLLPAVLLVHGGPGHTSRYLEPLAARLCQEAGRSCYLYDQLGRGMPNGVTLQHDAQDLYDVARHLGEHLGEPELHLLGHGFGGVLVMEALLRKRLWGSSHSSSLPRLRSVCLMGTPSSTSILKSEAWRLMRRVKAEGLRNAAASFWYRHYCSLRSLGCLTNAFADTAGAPLGGWEPWGDWVLRGWEIRRNELAKNYAESTGNAPFLSVRGENDFVTEACVEAWRGVRDSLRAPVGGGGEAAAGNTMTAQGFVEEVVSDCGHNTHLEEPEALGALLSRWLRRAEEPGPAPAEGSL